MKRKEQKEEKNEKLEADETIKDSSEKENKASAAEADNENSNCSKESDNNDLENLRKQLEVKCKEAEDNFNKYLRMQADFENYKRRIAREREELYFSSLEGIAKELLPVLDNLERAVSAFKNDELDGKYIDGVEMVRKQLFTLLEKNGVKEIEAQDKEFDPNIHHAVMQIDAEEDDENKIKEIFQKGYTIGSKVLRPSLVKVAVKNN